MSQPSSVDAADEAGGEAVFSSDGLPSLPTPRVPKIGENFTDTIGNEEDVLDSGDDTTLLNPNDAAKVFGGPRKESPLERLARLQRELSELEQELTTDEVAKFGAQLSARLHVGVGVDGKDDLVKLIDDHVAAQRNNGQNVDKAAAASSSSSNDGQLVYELYGGKAPSASSSLEERLLKLESVVGGNSKPESLAERVKEMEEKLKRLDTKSIDEAATRAKVIRSDLEAASKARSKLTSTTSSADSKMISELYTQLQQLDGVSAHLPALSHRLQQLAHIHAQGATFAGRLGAAEKALGSVQGTLSSVEASISSVEANMSASVAKMEQGLKDLGAN